MPQGDFVIRSATPNDHQAIANLVHYEVYVHRHLDWRSPLDWIGYQPCFIIERERHLIAALICPPDPPEAAWLRLFVVSQDISLEEGWRLLWSNALEKLYELSCPPVAAIATQPWFYQILEQNGFEPIQEITTLVWDQSIQLSQPLQASFLIRKVNEIDLRIIHGIDTSAFGALWRTSYDTLVRAYQQSYESTLIEVNGTVVGYQISTAGPIGGHLARLAVLPAYQGRGIGFALVQDVLEKLSRRGIQRVTVNTQRDNLNSLSVYKKAGFRSTNEIFPVYQYSWIK